MISLGNKKYIKNTISKYEKEDVFIAFKKSLLKKKYDTSIYFLNEIIASGFFKDLNNFYINFCIDYVHIFNIELFEKIINVLNLYDGLEKHYKASNRKNINIRNEKIYIQKNIEIVKNIIIIDLKHYLKMLPPEFGELKTPQIYKGLVDTKKKYIKSLFESVELSPYIQNQIDTYLKNYISCITKYRKNKDIEYKNRLVGETYYWLYNILTHGYEQVMVGIDEDNYLSNMYSSTDTDIMKHYTPKLWNIFHILTKNHTGHNKNFRIIYSLYKLKLTNFKFLILITSLYYFYGTYKPTEYIVANDNDMTFYMRLYMDIENSLKTNTDRKNRIKLNIMKTEEDIKRNILDNNPELKKKEIGNIINNIIVPNIKKEMEDNPEMKERIKNIPIKKEPRKRLSKKEKEDLEPNPKMDLFFSAIDEPYELTNKDNKVYEDIACEEIDDSLKKEKFITF